MAAPYTDWENVLDLNGVTTVSTATQFSKTNTDGTVTTLLGTGFTYSGDSVTGGTVTSMERTDGTSMVTQVSGINQSLVTAMDIFGAGSSTLASSIGWKSLFSDTAQPAFSATEISVDNTDGSKTVFVGTGLNATGTGNLLTGTVNAVEHRASDGSVLTSVATGGVTTYFAVAAVFDDGAYMGLAYLHQDDNSITGITSITGYAGNDTMTGSANIDWLDGGPGDDTMTGAGSSDVFTYYDRGFGDDTITDFDLGREVILFSQETGLSSMSQLTISGTSGGDALISSSEGSVTLQGISSLQLAVFRTAIAFDKEFNGPVVFTNGDDGVYLGHDYGSGLSYDALDGNDHVVGGYDIDTVAGGAGNDTLGGGYGDDHLSGGSGNDFVDGGEGNDTLTGDGGHDFIVGMWGNDYIDGGAGNDYLNGGEGDDTYIVDDTYDVVDEGFLVPEYGFGGTDTLISKATWFWDYYGVGDTVRIDESMAGVDTTIVAGIWNNDIYGNSGTNIMFGRGGSDTYHPGAGIDFISFSTLGVTDANAYAGVNGVNTLVMEVGNSYDVLFDFETAKDKVDLTAFNLADYAALQALGHDDGLGNHYYALGPAGTDYLYIVGLEMADMNAGDFILT